MARLRSATLSSMIAAVVPVLAGCGDIPGPTSPAAEIAAISRSAVPGGEGRTLSVLHAGDPQGRPVLLVHGTPGSAEAWADWLLSPPPGLYLVAVDRPGFGRTTPADPLPALQAQADALVPLLERLGRDGWGLGRPLLLGHSLGGPLVVRLALDHPNRVAGIVVAAGALDPDLEEVMWVQYIGATRALRWLVPAALDSANRELIALEEGLRQMAPQLPWLAVPTVVVHGTKDSLVPYANVAFMQAAWDRGQSVSWRTLEGADHFLPWNQAPVLKQALADLVTRTRP